MNMVARLRGLSAVFLVALSAQFASAQTAPAAPAAQGDAIRNGERFGDWIFECIALTDRKNACGLSQTIMTQEAGKVLAKMTIGRDADTNEMSVTVLLPFGIEVRTPASLVLGDGKIDVPVITCLQTGCLGRLTLDARALTRLRDTKSLAINIKFVQGREPAVVPTSVSGLADGLRRAKYVN